MSDGNAPMSDHDTLIEMRTEMKYIRAELTELNGAVKDISKALMPMPGHIEVLEQRITKSGASLS